MKLGRSKGGHSNTIVDPWETTWGELTTTLQTPEVGAKDGSYFTTNSMSGTRSKAAAEWGCGLFVLDGDSTLDPDTGEVRGGAPLPEHVSEALSDISVDHLIYSSHSNQLEGKGNRYRVLIPAEIGSEKEYAACVEWIIDQLHQQQVMLANVMENSSVSQPWYFPRCTEENRRYFQFYEESDGWCDFPVKEAVDWFGEKTTNLAQMMPEGSDPTRELDPSKPIDKFCMDHGMEYVCELLQEHGYVFKHSSQMNNHQSNHFKAPLSTSGGAGVNVYAGEGNGKVLVCSHHGEHDPLRRTPKAAIDAFQVYMDLEHKGDQQAALNAVAEPQTEPCPDGVVDFSSFSLRGKSEAMKKQVLEDTHVLGQLAILGQWTTFYAAPNTGKTLLTIYLLIEAIKSGELKSADVAYINADDHYKGLVEKLELAEKYGFEMLAPGHCGFKAKMLGSIMEKMIKRGGARGKVVVLDTLKKFTDLMDKKTSSEFGVSAREFIAAGGTIIGLAHVNKHKDSEGKSVHGGTTDIMDDNDCTYILDKVSEDGETKTVQFENVKSRGDVAQLASYRYTRTEGQTYFDLLDSVEEVSEKAAAREQVLYKKQQFMEDKREVVDEIVACINGGITLKTDLIKEVADRTTATHRTVKKVLAAGTGSERLQFWVTKTGEHNSQNYRLNEGAMQFGALF